MNLEKVNEVIKASPAIQIQSRISLLQRRAWNVLLANAYNDLPGKDIHSVSMVELAAKLGFGDENQEYLKEMLRALVACTVEWNLLNKDEKKEEWGVASLLAEVRIEEGALLLSVFTHVALEAPQSPHLHQAESTATKPVHQ